MEEFELTAEEERRADEVEEQDAERQLLLQLQHLHRKLARVRRHAAHGDKDNGGRPVVATNIAVAPTASAATTPATAISAAPSHPCSAFLHHQYPQSRSCSSESESESILSPSPPSPPQSLPSPALSSTASPYPPCTASPFSSLATPNTIPPVSSCTSPSPPPMSPLPPELPNCAPQAVDCYDGGSLDERIAAAKCPRFVGETNKLIVCAARRPGRLLQSRAGDALVYRPSQSGFKSSVDYIAETNRVQWVAWPGACVEDRTQEVVRKRLETEHSTYPIFVGRDTQSLFEGFCMDTLWPNLHGIPTDFNEKLRPALQQQQYDAYAYISQLYVEKVCDVYEEGDLVLVYDYELMLLPAQLRRRFPDITCGFFLHTPFPSSELFQELPVRTSILHGVLGADVIAFNHFDYVRHFQNSCTRILGLESYPTFEAERHYSFEYDGRLISLEICPAGIDPNKFGLALPPDHSTSKATYLSASEPSHSSVNNGAHADLGEVGGASHFDDCGGCATTSIDSAVAAIAAINTSGATYVPSATSYLPTEASHPSSTPVESAKDHVESPRQQRSMLQQQAHVESQEVPPDRESLKVVELMKQLERRFQRDGGKLVISLDHLDWCKGLPQKLIAMESLYERFPRWRKKVTFFLVVREQDGTLKHDRQLRQMVNRLVGKVNGRFGSADYTPVQYVVRTLSHAEIVALYSVADVALITSIREGVNLSAMEFIACQANVHEELAPWAYNSSVDDGIADSISKSSRYRNGASASTDGMSQAAATSTSSAAVDNAANVDGVLSPSTTIMAGYREKGVLVYSEFAGCASSFKGRGALVVNPYYADAVADAVQEALTMGRNKKHIIHERLHQYVSEYTSELWAERILRGLVKTSHDVRNRRLYNSQSSCGLQYHGEYSMPHLHHGMHHTGMGHYRHGILGYHSGTNMHGSGVGAVGGLDVVTLRTLYERTAKRLLVLDYDGALMTHQPLAQLSRPSEELLAALHVLCEDPSNTVIILTGRKRSDVEEWFRCLPRLGLVADHGYWIRPPRLKLNQNDVFGSFNAGEMKHDEHVKSMLHARDQRPKCVGHQETCAPFPESPSMRPGQSTQRQKDIECFNDAHGLPWEKSPASTTCAKGSDGSMQDPSNVATEQFGESIDDIGVHRNLKDRDESRGLPGEEPELKEGRGLLDLCRSSNVGGASSKFCELPDVRDIFGLRFPSSLGKDDACDVPDAATVEDGTVECWDAVNKGVRDTENDAMVAPCPWSLALTSENVDLSWMDEVMPILEDFTHRTPGSLIERSECCLTWHYRDTDGDFGISQAKNLQLHFDQMLQRRPVRVSTAAAYKYLSIQPSRVTKGRALNHLLMHLLPVVESATMVAPAHIAVPKTASGTAINRVMGAFNGQSATPVGSCLSTQPRVWNGDPSFDLVLSISDDRTDEDLHSSSFSTHRRNFNYTPSAPNMDFEGHFAVTVCGSGKRLPRNTTHSVEDPSEVLLVLNALARKDAIAKDGEPSLSVMEDSNSAEANP